MSGGPEITALPEQHWVGVRRTAKVQEIPAACSEILPRVFGWLQSRGVTPASRPMVVYHEMLPEGAFDLQPGFFVAEAVGSEGDIVAGHAPAGDAATIVHEGRYETLGESWARLHGWIEEQGRSTSRSAWEIYENDPGQEPDPAKWRTRIVVPLDPM